MSAADRTAPIRALRGHARIGWRDHLFGLAICVAYVGLLLSDAGDLGMSRDESFYVTAAQDYGRWMKLFWEDRASALTSEAIDEAWDYNHEHPGLVKGLFALSWLAHEAAKDGGEGGLFATDSAAFRFPGMLSAGLLLWLLYVFGARLFGRLAGGFAAASYAFMPRPYYHAHLDCFDIPIALAITFAVYAYWRALTSRAWVVMAGLAWGLALSTKHNSWVLPGILLVHFVWMAVAVGGLRKRGELEAATADAFSDPWAPKPAPGTLSTKPWWLVALPWLGPPVFIATWPWLWDFETTLERFGWYARFHLSHEHYTIAYFGRSYFEPPFPIEFPFVLTAFTVPLTTLVLAGVGIGTRLRAMLPRWARQRWWAKGRTEPDPAHTDVLLIGCFLAPLVVIALPSTPIFGGTKHWITGYPFLCLYAGLGLARVVASLRDTLGARLPAAHLTAPALALALCLAPLVVQTRHSHPFGLSHYTPLAGGVPGAADLGMNRQFWGFTTGSLTEFFRERMPDGGTVFLCDTTPGAWDMLQRDGKLPRNIRWSASIGSADYVMIHHEDHFAEVDFQAWTLLGTTQPVHVLTYDGVPIISVYENPRRVRAR